MSDTRLVIAGGTVVDPVAGTVALADVLIDGDRIVAVDRPGSWSDVPNAIDATGLLVLPGLVDMHVHLREPGYEYKETIATGGASALAGGFTSVACMANTNPVNDSGAVTQYIIERARVAGGARVYPIGAVSVGLKGERLAEIGEMHRAGIVAVSDDGRPVMDAGLMRHALEYATMFGLPVIAHEEDSCLAAGGVMNEGVTALRLGLRGTPSAAEEVMVARDIALAELTGGHLHVAHVSTAGSVALIRAARARGVRVTAEVTPHHLVLNEEAVDEYDTNAKMAPPLRSRADVDAVRAGLADGTIDAIATDHAPHHHDEKDCEFDHAANGIVGLETALPLALRLVADGVLDLPTLVARLTTGPAKILRLDAGTLAPGALADVTLVDPKRQWRVVARQLKSKSRNTPFEGWDVTGRATTVLVGGRVVYELEAVRDVAQERFVSDVTAILALADGTVFRGKAFGARAEAAGELVFNTSMTGYQEFLTDPSYEGQLVAMTYPQIGNVGVNQEDVESRRPFVRGFIVREYCCVPSSWRAQESLGAYLERHGIPGIECIDTRALVRHLRDHGSQEAVLSTVDLDPARLVAKAKATPGLVGRDLVREVTCDAPYDWTQGPWRLAGGYASADDVAARRGKRPLRVVAYDFGIKYNILRNLVGAGCSVRVVPASTPAAEVLARNPDGVFLSNGPGDPDAVPDVPEAVSALLGKVPVFGICLGHQILGLALGGKTYKLKFGHHGGNQPVQDLTTGKVEITAQNHGFAVDVDSLAGRADITHINLNDRTCEGLTVRDQPTFSVQYHPEASPGPHDASYLFRRFVDLMER